MAPKHNVDKGNAPMVEEEPRGPRTRSRSSALIIREQQERAQEAEDRAAQIGTSSDAYEEDERLYGQVPTVGQARTEEVKAEEVRTEGTAGLCPERGEPRGQNRGAEGTADETGELAA
ncbi:hypothetical protein ACLOJK_014807 [Asimina triloba]